MDMQRRPGTDAGLNDAQGSARRVPRRLQARIACQPAGAERFDAKTTVLMESVTHHIEEEGQDWFLDGRAGLGRKRLQELGAQLEQARKKAPMSPAQPGALKMTIDAVIS
jgi:hypothetical protein